jgi:hypothetical protein
MYFLLHCIICRPLDSTVLEDARIETLDSSHFMDFVWESMCFLSLLLSVLYINCNHLDERMLVSLIKVSLNTGLVWVFLSQVFCLLVYESLTHVSRP